MTSLSNTNDMLRAQGFNIPYDEDSRGQIVESDFESGVELAYEDGDERAVMDAAGWDVDSTPVDVFMERADMGFKYLEGMKRGYEE